jgi:hypothetical protein
MRREMVMHDKMKRLVRIVIISRNSRGGQINSEIPALKLAD